MSQRLQAGERDSNDVLSLEQGLEALQASPEFRGPVEPLDGHRCNDHFALIYESEADRFAAAIPIVRQGLERGERCMYVVDGERSEERARAAMRDAGIDVEDAVESGSLAFATVRDTYLRDGTFDAEEMMDTYADSIEETAEEYEALRVVAEMNWILDEDVTTEDVMEYESRVNDVFGGGDAIALCQYDREAFPPEVIADVVRIHPHLIYDDTVCHNFYYTPPEEFCGPERPAREVDRMLGTLLDRTEAKAQLRERERYLRRQNDIVSSPDQTFNEKLQDLFDLGCERFGLELGAMARVDPDADRFEVEYVSDDHDHIEPGLELPLSETYCTAATEGDGAAGVVDPSEDGYDDIYVYREFGIEAYIGTYVEVDGDPNRTFFFVSPEARTEPFSDEERTFLRSMGQWVKYELEREERENRLAALNTLSRRLMDAETATAVGEYVVEAAERTLDLPATAVALYDDRRGELRPVASTDGADAALRTTALLDVGGAGWDAFVEGSQRRVTDPLAGEDASLRPPVSELAVFPLADHGALIAGTTATDGFTPTDVEFAETVAANTRAALDRVERERQLQERERTLEEQNATLERLDRINDIIRSIDRGLVGASTRDEIESVVCEQLAAVGPYELAWIGEHDAVAEEITPCEWAGAEKGYLDGLSIDTDDDRESRGPCGRAVETYEPQVVNDVLEDRSFEPWRQAALNRGYHAAIALPLVYDDTLYGVLSVYADRPGVFDELERAVLSELADNIAYAIDAVESKKALVSTQVTELELTVDDDRLPLVRLARETDCELTVEDVVPRADGGLRMFFSTRGASAEAVSEFAHRLLPASSLEVLSEGDNGGTTSLFEADLTDESAVRSILEHGGIPKTIEVSDGTATVVVELAANADTREFVTTFRTKFPDSELTAQRTRERPQRTIGEASALLTDELTPRQLEVLQTAYASGYFEQPRTRSGVEIAEGLDISQPTFNAHVRTAQRKLCRMLFEEGSLRT